MDKAALLAFLAAEIKISGSIAKWAEAHGPSPQYIKDVLHGRRDPGPRILLALGIKKIVIYEKGQ
jgi:hypothetical protein